MKERTEPRQRTEIRIKKGKRQHTEEKKQHQVIEGVGKASKEENKGSDKRGEEQGWPG